MTSKFPYTLLSHRFFVDWFPFWELPLDQLSCCLDIVYLLPASFYSLMWSFCAAYCWSVSPSCSAFLQFCLECKDISWSIFLQLLDSAHAKAIVQALSSQVGRISCLSERQDWCIFLYMSMHVSYIEFHIALCTMYRYFAGTKSLSLFPHSGILCQKTLGCWEAWWQQGNKTNCCTSKCSAG